MNDTDLLALVTNLNREAAGANDELTTNQKDALDYYFMRPRGDEKPGRSQVVSGDLSAMVEANLASMMQAFTTDAIVEFEPNGPEDEDQAELESDTVSHFVMDANNGYWTFQEGIKDGLLLRNGIAKVWVEEKEKTRKRTFNNVSTEAYAEIAARPNTEVLSYKDGELVVRETTKGRKLRVGSVPKENVRYTKNWHSIDIQDIPYFAERHVEIRSALIERGFPKSVVNDLAAYQDTSTASDARNTRGGQSMRGQNNDKSLDEIEWWEAYILTDTDGDGVAERRCVSFVENAAILEDEECPFVVYAVGTPIINPHRLEGISLYDKLKQLQDYKTGLKRSVADNSNVGNKSRTAYLEGKVDDDDLSNGLVDGNIRVRGVDNVQAAIMAFNNPDISQGILANLQHSNQERAELGGAALDLAQGNAQLSDSVGSQGVDRAYSVMEQLAALMTRNMAESLIRNTYLLVHATLREHFTEPVPIKRQGRWDSANPMEWPARDRINVKIGMSPGERTRRVQALATNLQTQLALADKGYNNILVNLQGFYSTLMDWNRAADIKNPEQYYIDPSTDESKEALAAMQKQQQSDKQAQQKLTDMALALEQLRIGLDKYKSDSSNALKWEIEKLKAEIAEMQVVGKATTDLELAKNQDAAAKEKDAADNSKLDRVESVMGMLKEMDDGETEQ